MYTRPSVCVCVDDGWIACFRLLGYIHPGGYIPYTGYISTAIFELPLRGFFSLGQQQQQKRIKAGCIPVHLGRIETWRVTGPCPPPSYNPGIQSKSIDEWPEEWETKRANYTELLWSCVCGEATWSAQVHHRSPDYNPPTLFHTRHVTYCRKSPVCGGVPCRWRRQTVGRHPHQPKKRHYYSAVAVLVLVLNNHNIHRTFFCEFFT